MKRILITGANGQLGKSILSVASQSDFEVIGLSRSELDILVPHQWAKVLAKFQPEFVINTAAYTAVDAAETDRENAYALNEKAAAIAAEECAKFGARLVQISTDYVFDGKAKEPYIESQATAPLSVYGASKRAGELAVMKQSDRNIIVRVSWLYSPYGKNFYLLMRQLFQTRDEVNVVEDQVGSPTNAVVLAEDLLAFLAQTPDGGYYHYSQGGIGSWYDFAERIHQGVNASCRLNRVKSDFFPSVVTRPAYSKLDNAKFEAVLGRKIISWENALEACLKTEL